MTMPEVKRKDTRIRSSGCERFENERSSRMKTEPLLKFYTVNQVADALGVSPRTVRRRIKSGDLVAHHFGTAVRIAESDLEAFIAVHRDL
jgi:excisionase family DNA binding protein